MSALFTPEEIEALSAPHVSRAVFAELSLPGGTAYLHSGVGSIDINGITWRGVTDPFGGRLVTVSGLEEPAFGQVAAVTIELSGADKAFIKSVHATRKQIEGADANIYWAAFNAETEKIIGGLKKIFARGVMSSPTIHWQGQSLRKVSITIENIWAAMNFPVGVRWNGTGQRSRYPGDKGMDFAGVKVLEPQK